MKALFLLGLPSLLAACGTERPASKAAIPQNQPLNAEQEQAAISWGQQNYPDGFSENAWKFAGSAIDLNSDGREEVVVRFEGRGFCGSGGCPLIVMESDGVKYHVISKTTLSFLPIYVFPERTRGWLDLGVSVRRDYVASGVARLPFDGDQYAPNPTVVPASPASGADGIAVVPDMVGAAK